MTYIAWGDREQRENKPKFDHTAYDPSEVAEFQRDMRRHNDEALRKEAKAIEYKWLAGMMVMKSRGQFLPGKDWDLKDVECESYIIIFGHLGFCNSLSLHFSSCWFKMFNYMGVI